ncbi:exopolysaccharide biosynthesis protein [Sphingomonas aracearum]|uniref:Exopolysaccharide biosynthesis protein n=1 Tax=Sphingomonas aracearum TaxID=2283317 RepID=A0A369VXL2_9SPHN|nr:exopolysaccharide biosynthesis protein [Sphingomonas aracearum]RDE06579.1 exopolysaccharide biosynthesis protein [Sphingomonas aracearum]
MTEQPRKIRPSLIERAAETYDFGAQLRAAERPEPRADLRVVAPEPVAPAPEVETPPAEGTTDRPAPPVRVPGETARIDRELLAERGFLVPGAPISALAEEFRLVKRQLLLTAKAVRATQGDRARTILVCSANVDEGKTYCAINLALSMAAERDMHVVLVDADFAKPDVMGRLDLAESPGLLDALADPALDVETLLVPTDVPQLSLLPAGAKSIADTELLASERTTEVIAGLLAADPRRVLIFDSPPALAASPASVLALHVGQVMMVVRADKTSETDLREAVAQLDGCEHIQLLLNAATYSPKGKARFGSYYGEGDGQ